MPTRRGGLQHIRIKAKEGARKSITRQCRNAKYRLCPYRKSARRTAYCFYGRRLHALRKRLNLSTHGVLPIKRSPSHGSNNAERATGCLRDLVIIPERTRNIVCLRQEGRYWSANRAACRRSSFLISRNTAKNPTKHGRVSRRCTAKCRK